MFLSSLNVTFRPLSSHMDGWCSQLFLVPLALGWRYDVGQWVLSTVLCMGPTMRRSYTGMLSFLYSIGFLHANLSRSHFPEEKLMTLI